MSSKRPRTPTLSGTPSSPSPSPEPSSKAARTAVPAEASSGAPPLLCTLPPTCNPPNRPTPLASTRELETHYATYHAHVCAEPGCKCVFPEERLLELHQTECHDPIAAVRKERGEKIFACHLTSCNRMFSAPKTRRLHLIQAHGYPKEYFFAVTNKGVGGLLKKWGEGVSMVRGQWRPREHPEESDSDDNEGDDTERAEDQALHTQDVKIDTTNHGNGATIPSVATATANRRLPETKSWMADAPLIEEDSDEDASAAAHDSKADDLAGAMSSLSLVPATVRFGRGASRSGHTRGRGGGHRRKESRDSAHAMDVDHDQQQRDPHANGASGGTGRAGQPGRDLRGHAEASAPPTPASNDNDVSPPPSRRPPMPPRGLGRGARGRFPGRARILFAGRGRGM